MKSKSSGVTLIELMIVVAIVAVLAAVAIPSYRSYLLRSHRAEAKAALLNLAAAQEKFYLQNNTYAANAALTTAPPAGLGLLSNDYRRLLQHRDCRGRRQRIHRAARRRPAGRRTTPAA